MADIFDEILRYVKDREENKVQCKDCRHCEIDQPFGICKNQKAEMIGLPIYGQLVRLTSSCHYGEVR